jgi:hypothetical protein
VKVGVDSCLSFRVGPYTRTVSGVTWGGKGPKGGGIVGIYALRPRWQHQAPARTPWLASHVLSRRTMFCSLLAIKNPWSVAAERTANTDSAS